MREFEGIDHVDCRVRSLAVVEAFYDSLMPELGLVRKRRMHVDSEDEWHQVDDAHPCNVVEYYEADREDRTTYFVGFIERHDHPPSRTRIAFRVGRARLFEIEALLPLWGACDVMRSSAMDSYPAIFFDDPGGTKLELVAPRRGR